MANSFLRYLLFIILLFLYNCSNDGWSQSKKDFIEKECHENAKDQIVDESRLNEVCACVSEEFTSTFSWDNIRVCLTHLLLIRAILTLIIS